MEEILACENPEGLLLPVDSLFADYPAVTITAKQEKFCRNGNPIPKWNAGGEFFRVYSENGEFLMVGRHKDGALYTEKSFFEVN
jgi:tRNA pseudouridine55 synthase